MTSLTCLLIVCILAMNFVPSAAFCLDYKYCYNEDFLNYDKLEIHHEDHEERSATTCAMLCLREDPETLLVFAKVIDMNERLVCGCGGQAALGNGSGTMNDFFCKTCPDSEEKCGGESSISVYFVLHKEGECDEPETTTRQTTTTPTKVATVETTQPSTHINLFQLGCYTDGDVQEELAYLNVPEATVNACAATCNRVYPEKDLYLVKRNGTGLLCGCGHESSLSDSTQVAESECDFRCSDSLPCGGRDSFSAYGNSGWVARSSWTLLLFLVAALVEGSAVPEVEMAVRRFVALAVALALLFGRGLSVVVHLQTDGVARGDSGLTWRGTFPQMTQVSVCFRVFLLQTRETNYVVSYAIESHSNEIFVDVRYYQQEIRFGCCGDKVYQTFGMDVPLMTWIQVCFSLDIGARTLRFQSSEQDGVAMSLSRSPPESVSAGGLLMLGQDQDTVGGSTEAAQSLHGYLQDLVILNRSLSGAEMKAFTACARWGGWASVLVDFRNIEEAFSFGAVTSVVDLGYGDACVGLRVNVALFPETRDFQSSRFFCEALGGSVVLPRRQLENDYVTYLGKKYCEGARMWLGAEYQPGREYVETGTNHTLAYESWDHEVKGMDNSFAVLYTKRAIGERNWGISTPERKLCTTCGHTEPFALKVRGLCKETKFDKKFLIHSYSNRKPAFVGFVSSNLTWIAYNITQDLFAGYWRLFLTARPDIQAEMVMETRYSYPVGTHTWAVSNDICAGDVKKLKFTTCGAGMFTCDDGSCVNVTLRCDKKVDCADSSDEERCNPVLIPAGYDRAIPPPFIEHTFPADIVIEVDFRFIRTIQISDFSLSLDLRLSRRWKDGRLRFRNLRANMSQNVVEDLRQVWLPELTLAGADHLVADANERKELNFVDRQGQPLEDDDAELDEDQLYSGAQNDLIAVREYTLQLQCYYNLAHYPFDTQRCPLYIILAKYTSDLFIVRINKFGFSGNQRHHEYVVRDIFVNNLTLDNYAAQRLELVLRNQYIYYISAAYVPSCMLLVISYLTYFFDVEDFSNRVTVALTSLLVLATLFSELVGGLPKTSYLKLIDVWFLGCIVASFLMVMCLVIIDKRKKEGVGKKFAGQWAVTSVEPQGKVGGGAKKARGCRGVSRTQLNAVLKIAIPVVFGAFVILYCAFVMNALSG